MHDDALILEAHMRQALMAARSLGRQGLRVAVAESHAEWNRAWPVPTFASRYPSSRLTFANYLTSPEKYFSDLMARLRATRTRVLIPVSDGLIGLLLPRRQAISGLTSLALASDEALRTALDKRMTLELAEKLDVSSPRTSVINSTSEVDQVLKELGLPVVLKPNELWSTDEVRGRVRATLVSDRQAAIKAVADYLDQGYQVLAQEFVGGARETVKLFLVEGRVHAEFAQRALRMTPVLGGASCFSESIAMPEDLREQSLRLVRAMGLDGYSEVEFRRDLSGRPRLMEVNARLSESDEVPRRAGVDFPLLLWQWAAGERVGRAPVYKPHVRVRWLRGDFAWLRENWGGAGTPDATTPSRALAVFGGTFFRPTHYDHLDWRDPRPFGVELQAAALALRSIGHPPRERAVDQRVRQAS